MPPKDAPDGLYLLATPSETSPADAILVGSESRDSESLLPSLGLPGRDPSGGWLDGHDSELCVQSDQRVLPAGICFCRETFCAKPTFK